jgi:N-acetylneuraminic acid mutarotase
MEKFSKRGAIETIVCRAALALCVSGSVFELIVPGTQSLAQAPHLDGSQKSRVLTFADRVAYQYTIEEIYWRHRIWPKENAAPKPSLEEMMSREQIEQKVEKYLRDSQLLANHWQRPITSEQLQAEMNRMASQSKQPEVLQEIFDALGNDPALIAECLARPVLSARLVRELYADDERLHGPVRERAESELRAHRNIKEMNQTGGVYSEMVWIKSDSAPEHEKSGGAVRMSGSRWNDSIERLATQLGNSKTAGRSRVDSPREALVQIQTGVISGLLEDDSRYYATAVLEKGKDRLKVATIAWMKEPFEAWAATAGDQTRQAPVELAGGYTLPQIGSFSTSCTPDSWVATTTNAPDGRAFDTAVWTGSEMIVWGGSYYDFAYDYLNTGGRYNPSTDSWVQTPITNAPAGRFYHTAVWTGSEMIVWGGLSSNGDLNSGSRYNPGADSWATTSTANAPAARDGHTAVWTGSEMIVWGGISGNSFLNSGSRYNPRTDSWVATTTTSAPDTRAGHTAVWTGNEMIVWGGVSGSSYFNTGGRYNPRTDSWVATNIFDAPDARLDHTAVWTGSEMIVWGGDYYLNGYYHVLNNGSRYNPSTDSWVATTTVSAPDTRERHTAVWTGSEMIVWGGLSSSGDLNSGGRYNPGTDSWGATSDTNAPAARCAHTAVWTGSEMIIWGGYDGSGGFNSGGRYSPSTDSWIATSVMNAPVARTNHTAVWTGSEMIIWGGENGNYWNTGGRYNPSTDSWTATSMANAPDGRALHTAVWTGSEMIVWGGSNSGGIFNTGGRYNPSTDSWAATSTTNAPAARYIHTAVWTGNEMIVWGGYNGGIFNTGGRYNPNTDSWVATSTTNAPAARYSHTAVWTGSEMIVWGGDFLTGGRYSPSTDGWVATNIVNAPDARWGHTAVWTGNEMIVWGGAHYLNGYDYYLNSGSRYNPSTDSWVATTTASAPDTRVNHTAVWTGSEMIVWGGYYSDGHPHFLNSGGHYNPSTDSWVATTTIRAPEARYDHTAVWTSSEMIVWGGDNVSGYHSDTGGIYCAQPSIPTLQSAVSRKTHGNAGDFDINLPLTGTPGIECRTGGATDDYTMIVTFGGNITVTGNPQAQVTLGTGCVGSSSTCTGNVSVSGNVVTIPLTNIANAQTINVQINGVNIGATPATDFTIPMSILIGDTNANGTVNAADVALTNAHLGQPVDAINFRSDVNTNGSINAADTAIIKQNSGTSLPQ